MKKCIVLCLLISLTLTPIAEAKKEEITAQQKRFISGMAIVVGGLIIYSVIKYYKQPWEKREAKRKKRKREKRLSRAAQERYETNSSNVLSWAKEGMDESAFRDKIGATFVDRHMISTYTSGGFTVNTYQIYTSAVMGKYSPGGYVWLTFINGKLDSISTFR